jgi:hypothetical protein
LPPGVAAALACGGDCLVLTSWTVDLQKLAEVLGGMGHDLVVLGEEGRKGAAPQRLAALEPASDGCLCSSSSPGLRPGKASAARLWMLADRRS